MTHITSPINTNVWPQNTRRARGITEHTVYGKTGPRAATADPRPPARVLFSDATFGARPITSCHAQEGTKAEADEPAFRLETRRHSPPAEDPQAGEGPAAVVAAGGRGRRRQQGVGGRGGGRGGGGAGGGHGGGGEGPLSSIRLLLLRLLIHGPPLNPPLLAELLCVAPVCCRRRCSSSSSHSSSGVSAVPAGSAIPTA